MATLNTQSGYSDIRAIIRNADRAREFYRAARTACVASGYITAEEMDRFGKSRMEGREGEAAFWMQWVAFALGQVSVAFSKVSVIRGTTDEEHAQGFVEFPGIFDVSHNSKPADAVIEAILAKLPF